MSTQTITPQFTETSEFGEWNADISEYQVGTYFDRRFVRQEEDGTFFVVTVSTFVEDTLREEEADEAGEDEERYQVRTQVEELYCTDWEEPGGTELTSDYNYTDGAELYADAEAAHDAAKAALFRFDITTV